MTRSGAGAYLAVFLLMALTFIGIPAVGPAVVGWAAVLASQGELNIVVVLIVAALGAGPVPARPVCDSDDARTALTRPG